MITYILKTKTTPELNCYGTAEEIWKHTSSLGYEGPTKALDGFPVPSGDGIRIEKAESRKAGTVRLRNRYWHQIESIQKSDDNLSSQGAVIEYGVRALKASRDFGKIYATTPEGIKEFKSVLELMMLSPYFDAVGFNPVIGRDIKEIEKLLRK